jgi:hypothetical protein
MFALPALDVDVARTSLHPITIAAGTPITCELGHTVCVTVSDLRSTEPLVADMFARWQAATPKAGASFPACSICEGAVHREGPDGVELHTLEGWRSVKGPTASGLATKADVEHAVALLDARICAMTRRIEASCGSTPSA